MVEDLARSAVIPRRTAPGFGGPVARHAEAPAWRAAGRNVSPMRKLVVAGTALASALTMTACSGSSGHNTGATGTGASTGGSPSATSTAATRWWSNAAAGQGSTISPGDPTADAGKLHPDRAEYCSMLKQTVAAGKSILPGATATDPRLLTSTEAFVSELQHVAPSAVSQQWQLLGNALIQFVKTKGQSLGSATTAQINAAAQTISTDATQQCHVDISTSGTGS